MIMRKALILVVLLLLLSGCIGNSVRTADDDIKFKGGSSQRTSLLTSTKTITVQGTFTNEGKIPHTFFGGVSIYDTDFSTVGFKGETMTLSPGQSKSITQSFVVDYGYNFKGVTYSVEDR